MAQIRPRGDKRWEVIVDVSREDGRRRQVSRIFHGTKPEAKKYGAKLEVEVQEGKHSRPRSERKATVGELLDEWQHVASPGWSPSTVLQTRRIVDKHLRPRFGKVPVIKLTTAQLDRFYADLRRGGLEPATIRRIHGVLHRALAQAERWDRIAANPARRATLPKISAGNVVPPDPTTVANMIGAATEADPDLGLFLRLAAITGARRGELCALQWADLTGDVLSIGRSVVDAGERRVVVKGLKNRGKRRLIPMDPETLALLERHRLRMAERFLACGAPLPPWMFTSLRRPDEPWRPDSVGHAFIRVRNEAGLSFRLHDLRHFAGTYLADGGIPMATVSKRLGHDRQSTTSDIYGHAVDSRDREATVLLAKLLAG